MTSLPPIEIIALTCCLVGLVYVYIVTSREARRNRVTSDLDFLLTLNKHARHMESETPSLTQRVQLAKINEMRRDVMKRLPKRIRDRLMDQSPYREWDVDELEAQIKTLRDKVSERPAREGSETCTGQDGKTNTSIH